MKGEKELKKDACLEWFYEHCRKPEETDTPTLNQIIQQHKTIL